ncbi:YqaA family protein [Chloroflexota bacterium]
MSTVDSQSHGGEQKNWLGSKLLPLLILLLVIAFTIGLFIFSQRYPDVIERFKDYGYLGVFLVSVVSSATIIVLVPGIVIFFPLVGTSLDPVLVGLVAATGGILGEITGYIAGYSGQNIISQGRMYHKVEGWMKKWGSLTVFVFAAVPILFFDVVGVVAGAIRFPLWKFLLVGWAGKSIKFTIWMLGVAWGWEFLLD